MRSLLFLFLSLSFLTACDMDVESTKAEKNYSFKVNGCSTGDHKFKAKSEAAAIQKMCNTLKDNSANNNCAFNSRCDHFKSNCPGAQWEECNGSDFDPLDEDESNEDIL